MNCDRGPEWPDPSERKGHYHYLQRDQVLISLLISLSSLDLDKNLLRLFHTYLVVMTLGQ
jgi:hypothetical protein